MRILPSKRSRSCWSRPVVHVKVLDTNDKWFGVTYKEDKKSVMDAISEMKQQGVYPEDLWK